MKHTITDKGYELDQIEYLSKLKPITNMSLTCGKDADTADAVNSKCQVVSFFSHGTGTCAHDKMGCARLLDSTPEMVADTMLPPHQKN